MANVTDTTYASEANIGYLAQWKIGQNDGSPETFVSVCQVARIKFGEMTAGILNKTHLRSPGRAHEKIATIRDLGPFQMTGQLNMRHGSHNNAGGDGFTDGGLIAIHRSLEERNQIITYEDNTGTITLPFRGVVNKLDLGELTLEGIQEFSCEVQPLADYTAELP